MYVHEEEPEVRPQPEERVRRAAAVIANTNIRLQSAYNLKTQRTLRNMRQAERRQARHTKRDDEIKHHK